MKFLVGLLMAEFAMYVNAECVAPSTPVETSVGGGVQRCLFVGVADPICGANAVCEAPPETPANGSTSLDARGVCCRRPGVTVPLNYCPFLSTPVYDSTGEARSCAFIGFPDLVCGANGACVRHPTNTTRGVCCTSIVSPGSFAVPTEIQAALNQILQALLQALPNNLLQGIIGGGVAKDESK